MSTPLTSEQIKELHAWLLTKGVVLTNLGQRFADGTELARLLKMMYPRRVELHNYSSCSSTVGKVANWNTLSFKVLSKLQIKLTKPVIDELAKGLTPAVEALLYRILMVEKTSSENAMKQSSLALRTLGREKSSKDMDPKHRQTRSMKSSNDNSNAMLAAAYRNEPPPDEQKIIAELCKELHIDTNQFGY